MKSALFLEEHAASIFKLKSKPSRALLAACFMVVYCVTYSSDLKMEAKCSFKTSVDFQWTTQQYNPEDRCLHNHSSENLISYKGNVLGLLPLALSEPPYRHWFCSVPHSSFQVWSGLYQAWFSTFRSFSLPPASAKFLLGLLFDPEDGSSMSLWNAGLFLHYKAYNREDHILQSL
jgi:hypothetical protein